jgi:hypothetical protein
MVLKKRALGTMSTEIKLEFFMAAEIYLFAYDYSVRPRFYD